MSLIQNEQSERKVGSYLAYEGGKNILFIESNLYKIASHYSKDDRASVICKGDACIFCKNGYQKRNEYQYCVKLNDVSGMLDIKPSVFFQIQDHAKTLEDESRNIKWVVNKKGEGLKTEYAVTPMGSLSEEDKKRIASHLEENNQKLIKAMEARESRLDQKYAELVPSVVPQMPTSDKTEKPITTEKSELDEQGVGISPDDIPF